jgi:hypothetical protein
MAIVIRRSAAWDGISGVLLISAAIALLALLEWKTKTMLAQESD